VFLCIILKIVDSNINCDHFLHGLVALELCCSRMESDFNVMIYILKNVGYVTVKYSGLKKFLKILPSPPSDFLNLGWIKKEVLINASSFFRGAPRVSPSGL